jgi:LytR cell envelope-related transcriptional attenuator
MALAAAAVVAGAVLATLVVPRESGPFDSGEDSPAVGVPAQLVVVWTLWDERPGEAPLVAVLAAGGGREPVAVAVPGNTEVDVPGHGNLAVLDEVAASGDLSTVAATVENMLGVRVDEAWGIDIEELGSLVDAAGGIQAGFERLEGGGAAAYLRDAPDVERAIRWQEVLTGLSEALDGAALPRVPEQVRPVFTAGPRQAVILPVEDIGAGLVRPAVPEVAELVSERFVPTGFQEKVRLVVLNGNGAPGIGEEVARRLVPEGFRVVASENLEAFDQKQTSIVATSGEYLEAAHTARRLLGVGRVFLGEQPTYVADVFVIVGKDFVPPDAGGP